MGASLPVILQEVATRNGVSTTTTFVYGLGLIAMTDGAGVTNYYLPDGLGSTTQLTNATGAITDSYAYDVFGAIRSSTGSTPNDFRFTGEQHDYGANRGLYNLRARYYDPALGRFLSRDPFAGLALSPQTLNRYPYVMNNPSNLEDPYGLFGCGPLSGVCKRGKKLLNQGVDLLSDPKNLASGVQLVSGSAMTYFCPAGQVYVCGAAVLVYTVASGAKLALSDSEQEFYFTATTGLIGYIPAGGAWGKVIAAFSDVIDPLSSYTPVYGTGNDKEGTTFTK